PWLKLTNTTGIDFTNRIDQETVPPASSGGPTSGFADDPEGKRTSNPFQLFVYTLNTNATGTFDLNPTVRSTTSVGVQFNDEIARGTLAFGQKLLAGSSTLSGAATLFTATETNTENRLIGGYVQEQIGWRDRVFVTAALRGDKNSAFGKSFKFIQYPAASVSWVVGDESFFPRQRFVSSLRLRSAFGESGQRPGVRDAIKFYAPVSVTVNNASEAGFTVGGIGNINLKPERTREFEGGFDAGLLRDRINLEFTGYAKTTHDALILRPLGPSNGNVLSRFENLGQVSNKGIEMLVNGKILTRAKVDWDVTLNSSWNVNKVVDLGSGIKPIVFGANSDQRHQNGYPLGAYFVRPITSYKDIDGNGYLSRVNCPGQPVIAGGPACEITLGDSALYAGSPFPTREFAISSRLNLFKRFTFNAVIDHRGGQKLLNFTEYFRCASFGNCQTANDAKSPFVDQAAYLSALMGSDAGYVQDASFTKLRELSLRVDIPESWSRKARVRGLALTVAGRNLHTWTNYKGLDPEINENGQANFQTDEFLSQPLVRFWTFRLDINW
ncbi:MAG: TonB-dependent receptor, partial [Gemmatimonadota bacterium]|nr:TonB-dependent receptor [Gemmatimonadota bacterium]